jgi:hypothetical protein
VSRQQAQKKICLDFVRAVFSTSVWLQAGQYLAPAAQIPAKQKSGCPRRWYRLQFAFAVAVPEFADTATSYQQCEFFT